MSSPLAMEIIEQSLFDKIRKDNDGRFILESATPFDPNYSFQTIEEMCGKIVLKRDKDMNSFNN